MPRWVTGVLGLTGSLAASAPAWAQERPWGWGGHPMWGMWGGWGLGMFSFVLVFWVLVLVALVLGIRWLVSQGGPAKPDSALEVLRQRYARGEIDRDEFEQKRRDLA